MHPYVGAIPMEGQTPFAEDKLLFLGTESRRQEFHCMHLCWVPVYLSLCSELRVAWEDDDLPSESSQPEWRNRQDTQSLQNRAAWKTPSNLWANEIPTEDEEEWSILIHRVGNDSPHLTNDVNLLAEDQMQQRSSVNLDSCLGSFPHWEFCV